MSSPIAIASALAQMVTITCPWCGHDTPVSGRPVASRVWPRPGRHFSDRFAKRK